MAPADAARLFKIHPSRLCLFGFVWFTDLGLGLDQRLTLRSSQLARARVYTRSIRGQSAGDFRPHRQERKPGGPALFELRKRCVRRLGERNMFQSEALSEVLRARQTLSGASA